jgi:hypothetical protein
MGNACTFPVESLLFMSVCLAVILTVRKREVTRRELRRLVGQVAIFGDDIVIPEDSRELLYDALRVLDFKVNTDKSFWTGKFRESCGVDSFRGSNVTPVYWKAPCTGKPESIASAIEVSNNFYQKFLLSASECVASTIRKALPIVAVDSGVLGLKSRVGAEVGSFQFRWNALYQRMESLVPMLVAKVRKTPTGNDSGLLQYFTERPSQADAWKEGVAQRPILRFKYGWVPTDDLIAQ